MRLKEWAESRGFGNNREDRILEQLVQTTEEDSKMITKAKQKQWNLNKFLKRRSKSA